MRTIKGYLDEWRVQEYLLITFFISWLSWGVLILLTALNIAKFTDPIGMIFFVIGGFGPTISAIMCIDGKMSLKKIVNFIFTRKKRTFGYSLLFIILEILVVALSAAGTNAEMPLYALPFVFLTCAFVGGGNEELGWRGTMQPLLEKIFSKKIKNPVLSFIVTTLLVGVVWALWHLPLWFVSGSTQQSINFGWFAIDAVIQSFVLACVYRRTGSVFNCMLLHGLINVLMSFFVIQINWIMIIGTILMVILATLLAVWPDLKKTAPKVAS